MTAAHAPEWARVVLDDLGLRDWALEWAGRRWVRRNHTHGMAYLDERRIVVAAHCDPHEQLYTLIHEAAHAMIDDGAPRHRDDHSAEFYRVVIMLAGFYGFGVDSPPHPRATPSAASAVSGGTSRAACARTRPARCRATGRGSRPPVARVSAGPRHRPHGGRRNER